MKKSLKILATALCAVIAAAPLALSACGEDETPPAGHTHAYTYTPNGDGTHNGVCANADGKCTEINIANEACADGNSDGECDKCHAEIGSSDEMTEAKWKAAFDALKNADYFQIADDPDTGVSNVAAKFDRNNRLAVYLDDSTNMHGLNLEGYFMHCYYNTYYQKWDMEDLTGSGSGDGDDFVVEHSWVSKGRKFDSVDECIFALISRITIPQILLVTKWSATEEGDKTTLENFFSSAVYDEDNDVYKLSLFMDEGPGFAVLINIKIENGKIVNFKYGMESMMMGANITYNHEILTPAYGAILENEKNIDYNGA